MLAVDGTEPDELRKMMQLELDNQAEYEDHIPRVFESAGGFAPTIGIIGAVLGLIQVMQHLDNLDEVGRGIAVAFVATVYGVGSANLFFLPGSGKLRIRIREEQVVREMTLEGVVSILEGMNPRMLETKLLGFLQDDAKRPRTDRGPAMNQSQAIQHSREPRALAGLVRRLHHPDVRILCGDVLLRAHRQGEDGAAHRGHPVGLSGTGSGCACESHTPHRRAMPTRWRELRRHGRDSHDANHKPEDFAAIQKELEKLLSPEIKRREVALRIEPDGLIISLREIGFFDSGSAADQTASHGGRASRGRISESSQLLAAHRRPHRQCAHPHRIVCLQLGTLHRSRHRAGEVADRSGRLRSGAAVGCRLWRVSSRGRQLVGGRSAVEPQSRYRGGAAGNSSGADGHGAFRSRGREAVSRKGRCSRLQWDRMLKNSETVRSR